MIVCVAGNPAIDKLFEVEAVRPGEIHRPEAFIPLPGGKGIHVAQVGAALGAEAVATGILGGHHGRWLAETLVAEGVPGVFAWAAAGETRSCLTVADRATGGLTEFYEDGIRATPEDWAGLAGVVDELLARGPSWLAMAGSVPARPGVEGYSQLVRSARAAGVRSAVDSRGPDLARAIEQGPDLVKINAAEAGELLEIPGLDGIAGARDAAQAIRDRAGAAGHAVVITLGEEGIVLIDPAGEAWHGAVGAHGNYPVGSGDAFLAGLLVALDAGPAVTWAEAARLGLGAAAANAEVPGAARLDPARARELAARAEVRALGAPRKPTRPRPYCAGMHITAHIVVDGADAAATFYAEAFGAEEIERIPTPDGRLMSVQLRIGESVLHVSDEFPEMGVVAPPTLGGSPVVLALDVPDADAAFTRAVEAGATARQPVGDMFWGERHAQLEDPFGHRWNISQFLRDVPHEEVVAAAARLFS